MRRGALLPLYPTLNGQLYAISREYGLPSIGGLAIYLCEDSDGNMGPRIGETTWQILWSKYFADEEDYSASMDPNSLPPSPFDAAASPHGRDVRPSSRTVSRTGFEAPDQSHAARKSLEAEISGDGQRTPSATGGSLLNGHVRRPTGGSASYRGSPALGFSDLDGSFNSGGRPSSRLSASLPIVGRVEWTVEKHKAPWWPSWIGEADAVSSTRSSSDSAHGRKRAQHNKQKSLQLYKRFGSVNEMSNDTMAARTVDDNVRSADPRSRQSSKEERVSQGSIIEKSPADITSSSNGSASQRVQRFSDTRSLGIRSQDIGGSDEQASARSSRARTSSAEEPFPFSSDMHSVDQRRYHRSDASQTPQGYQQLEETDTASQEEAVATGPHPDPMKPSDDLAFSSGTRSDPSQGRTSRSPVTVKSTQDRQPASHPQATSNSHFAESSSFAGYSALLDEEDGSHRPGSHVSHRDLPRAESTRRETLRSNLQSDYSRYSHLQRSTMEGIPDSDESMWRALRDAPQPPGGPLFTMSEDRIPSQNRESKRSHYSSSHSQDPSETVSQWINRTQFSPDLLRRRSDFVQEDIPDLVEKSSDDRDAHGNEEDEEALLPPEDDVRDVVHLWAEKAGPSTAQQLAPSTVSFGGGSPSLETPDHAPQSKLLSPIALGEAGTFQGPAPQLGTLSRTSHAHSEDDSPDDLVAEQESSQVNASAQASHGLLNIKDGRLRGLSAPGQLTLASKSLKPPRSPGEISTRSSSTDISGLEDFERALELLSPVASNHANSPSLAYLGRRPDGQRMTSRDSLAAAKSLSTSVTPSPRWLSKNRTPRAGYSGPRGLTADADDGRPKSASATGASRSPGFSEHGQWPPASSGRLADQVMQVLSPAPPGEMHPSPLRRRVDASSEVSASPGDIRQPGPGHSRETSGATTASEYEEGDEGVEARKGQRRQLAQDTLNGTHSHSSSVQLSTSSPFRSHDQSAKAQSVASQSETLQTDTPHSAFDDSVVAHDLSQNATHAKSARGEGQALECDSSFDLEEETAETTVRPEDEEVRKTERQSTASASISDSHFWRQPDSEVLAMYEGSSATSDKESDADGHVPLPSSSPHRSSSSELPLYGHDLTSPDETSYLATPRAARDVDHHTSSRNTSSDGLSVERSLGASGLLPSSPEGSTDDGPPSIARLIRGQSFSASSIAPSSAAQTPNTGDSYAFEPLDPLSSEGRNKRDELAEDRTLPANGTSFDASNPPAADEHHGEGNQSDSDVGYDDDDASETHTAQQHQGRQSGHQEGHDAPQTRFSFPQHQFEDSHSDVWSQDGSRYSSRFEDRQSVFGTRSASNSAFSRFEESGPETPAFFFDQHLTDSRPNSYRVSKAYSNGSSMPPRSPLGSGAATVSGSVEGPQTTNNMGLGLLPSDGSLHGGANRSSALSNPPVSAEEREGAEAQEGQGEAQAGSKDVADELDAMLSDIDAFNHTDKARPWSRPNSRASSSRKLADQRSLTLPDLSNHRGTTAEEDEDLQSMTLSTREAVRQALTGSDRVHPEQLHSRLSLSSTKSAGNIGMGGYGNHRRSQSPRRASSSSASARLSTNAVRQTSQDSFKGPGAERMSGELGPAPRANSLSAATTSPHGRFKALPPSPSLIPNLGRSKEPMSPLVAAFASSGGAQGGGSGNLFNGPASTTTDAASVGPPTSSNEAIATSGQPPQLVTSPTLASSASFASHSSPLAHAGFSPPSTGP